MTYQLFVGNNLEILPTLPDNSVDSIVTDPPYGLSDNKYVADTIARWIAGERDFVPDGKGFMGKAWDAFVPPPALWDKCLRVLKPGGHLLAFFGSRTQDIGALAIRLAGFEIRDSIAWLYGSGFPKSMDISKAIDKKGGNPLAFHAFADAYDQAVKKSKFTHSDIDKFLGVAASSCYWVRKDDRGGMPPRHHWDKLREMLEIPKELESIYEEAEREVIGQKIVNGAEGTAGGYANGIASVAGHDIYEKRSIDITAPSTLEAQQWQGWGTALKPALEPIVVARKPIEGTVANNVLKWGTGGLNIDGSRIGTQEGEKFSGGVAAQHSEGWDRPWKHDADAVAKKQERIKETIEKTQTLGRWPANIILDEQAAQLIDEQSGQVGNGWKKNYGTEDYAGKQYSGGSFGGGGYLGTNTYADSGGASRFFYVAKASKRDRNEGTELNNHPTVKPTTLMEYLVKLVTPPNGTVLDPFTGSGSTGKAAILQGFNFIGIEMTEEYVPIIEGRLKHAEAKVAEAKEKIEAQPQGLF